MKNIFKYVVPERIDILENLQIRITQPKYLNDPFDSLLSFKKVVEKDLFLSNFNSEKVFEDFMKKDGAKSSLETLLNMTGKSIDDFKSHFYIEIENLIDLFTKENETIKNLLNDEINKFLGVISFTESPNNIPMWAYYADIHKGFVVVFKSNHNFFNNGLLIDKDFGLLQKVVYSPKKTVLDTLKEFKSNPFFEKHIRWNNEEEWRMILPLSFASITKFPDIHLITIPSEIIDGIIFGYRCDPNLMSYVHKLMVEEKTWNHLKLYKAVPLRDNYRMDIINYES